MRVLIADDDPIIRLDLRQMLENLGHEVIAEAEDGVQAEQMAREQKPEVCIFDVKMPLKDGVDAAQAVTEDGIAPVILLTAYSDPDLIERATNAGVFGYLVKPFKPSDLPPAIEVARSRFMHSLKLSEEVGSLESKLEQRKTIEKAKGKLMERDGITESEAYRRIQTQAMNDRTSMNAVAEKIIAE